MQRGGSLHWTGRQPGPLRLCTPRVCLFTDSVRVFMVVQKMVAALELPVYGRRGSDYGRGASIYGCRASIYGRRAIIYGRGASIYGRASSNYGPGASISGLELAKMALDLKKNFKNQLVAHRIPPKVI